MTTHWKNWVDATFVVAVITAVFMSLDASLGLTLLRENLDEMYILGIVIVATRDGPAPAVWASFLSLGFWHYIMRPYYGPPHFSPWQVAVSLPVFMVVAVLSGQVAAAGRRRELEAQARERETAALYELSLAATSEADTVKLFDLLATRVQEVCRVAHCSFWLQTPRGEWEMKGTTGPAPFTKVPVAVVKMVLGAADATDILPHGFCFFLPLRAGEQTLGFMVIQPGTGQGFPARPEKRMLQAVANHASLTLLRENLDRRATEARANLEAERLKASLLSSVSHDLRTPLSSIKACATSLVSGEATLDEETRNAMMQSIINSADRLNAFVGNLLDISRLEAGAWQPIQETFPFVDILSSVLGRFTDADADRIHIQADADLPLIRVDGLQIEQVLWNLLENAVKYSPAGTPIVLTARGENDMLRVSVRDQGSGIPAGKEEDIFRKFYRARTEGGPPGMGVGLSICKAAVEAHHGRIWAENDANGGAVFTFVLPLDSPAELQAAPV